MDGKSEIRKRLIGQRNAIPREEIKEKSRAIHKKVMELEAVRLSSILMAYLSFGSEVDLDGLIRWCWGEGKWVVVPVCRPENRELTACRIDGFDELETCHYGIRAPKAGLLRPVEGGKIDVILVPALAFDRRGYRVGYGGGYYDRFLPEAPQAAKIGVAFACQIVEEIPADTYDVTVDRIVTEEGIIIPPIYP
jgi:5-formyltetrahydrofolate cyclo-ligase